MSLPLHDERWANWIAKGALADARTRRHMRIVFAVMCVLVLTGLTAALW
jgi:hypothetical protein